jgi:hypothetical protein
MDVHHEPSVERDNIGEPRLVGLQPADEATGRSFQNAYDTTLGSSVTRLAFDTGNHPITMHRFVEIRSGDVQVAVHTLDRLLRHHEPKPSRVYLHPARHEMHPIGKPVSIAADPNEFSRLNQGSKTAPKRNALLGREL